MMMGMNPMQDMSMNSMDYMNMNTMANSNIYQNMGHMGPMMMENNLNNLNGIV